ncbi:YifB family Mg chelatase-like AAA ATPase [Paludibacterium yongneupense]|uniref:YifB family Mg chelatase-like AAA ATPase n=1 Tax=Paludibacterium yongneupense TaxID=400061 RepID=UPI0003FB3BD4|nr:YifB family Mg chelatase-like AAA ATPase [Paludibacterium yongneupense]
MRLATVHSRALSGGSAPEVAVEAHLANGLPSFNIVGLPDAGVRESRDRVRSAILSSGFEFPLGRLVVNLAPADLPKESGRFDLPIALGILAASGQLPAKALEGYEFAGELALGGGLRPVRGAVAMVWEARCGGRIFVLPAASAGEAAVIEGIALLAADNLGAVCAHLAGRAHLPAPLSPAVLPAARVFDLADVKGQALARLALEVVAAGGHSLLLVGPPGAGKSMLAQRLPGLLPLLDDVEAQASAALLSLSVAGFSPGEWRRRPFRSPHHSASAAAMVGGGSVLQPGEISLAHQGILFLDELPEFDRRVLEALREPLECGEIHIARAGQRAVFPARFQLVAAMNPCPCGFRGQAAGRCRCSPEQLARYRGRLSGPLLDRIDVQIEVPALTAQELASVEAGENSAAVAARVLAARKLQFARQGKINAFLSGAELERDGRIDADASHLLLDLFERLGLSARSFHRVLRVARTLADLQAATRVERAHVMQAVQLRRAL